MPVARPEVIPFVCNWLKDKSYKDIRSVLDVGAGFGIWGFLTRNFVQIWHPGITKEEYLNWRNTMRCDGLDNVSWYFTNLQKELYNNCYAMDLREICKLGYYDLIIVGDTLEHVNFEEGSEFIEKARERCRWLIITMPDYFLKGTAIMGNPGELHEHVWRDDEFPGNPHIEHIGNQKVIIYENADWQTFEKNIKAAKDAAKGKV